MKDEEEAPFSGDLSLFLMTAEAPSIIQKFQVAGTKYVIYV
jgi:hypothetical protein